MMGALLRSWRQSRLLTPQFVITIGMGMSAAVASALVRVRLGLLPVAVDVGPGASSTPVTARGGPVYSSFSKRSQKTGRRCLILLAAQTGIVLAGCLMFTPLLSAQEKRLTFEVASIKPAKQGYGGRSVLPKPEGQGYEAQNATVRYMVSVMYKVPIGNVIGGPSWFNKDPWNVDAKADHAYSRGDLRTMFQNLLADEFKLKFHKESEEGPVLALMVDKSGSKMKVNADPPDSENPIDGHIGGVAVGRSVPMESLCSFLKWALWNDDRPVIDKTGLTGYYDFKLTYLPELPPFFDKSDLPSEMLERPSIFDALRDQLGLRLVPQKGQVDHYVIDHVEKPSMN